MLVFARKVNQTFWIGDDVEIAILEVHDEFVRVGINAPKHIVVDRDEVREKRLREKAVLQRSAEWQAQKKNNGETT